MNLTAFHVEITRAGRVVNSFEAMSTSSCDVVAQHADLCEPGSKMRVMRLDTWQSLRREADRAQSLELARDPMGGFLS